MSSDSLIFSSAVFNLLSLYCPVSDTVVIFCKSLISIFFLKCIPCLHWNCWIYRLQLQNVFQCSHLITSLLVLGWIWLTVFFLLIMDHIILLLCMPSNISLDTTHCKFSFLNEIFCSLTNILEFCLRAPVSDLRTAWSLSTLFLRYGGWDQSSFQHRGNYIISHY